MGPQGPKGDQGIPGNPFPEAPSDGAIYGRGGSTVAWVPTLPIAGGTLTGNVALTNTVPTGSNNLLALNQPNLANGQYGLMRIGVDANTNFKSGYVAWVPNATANLSYLSIGVRGWPSDMIALYGNGQMTLGTPTVLQNSNINTGSLGSAGGLGFKQIVSVTGSAFLPGWQAFNQWNVNSDTAANTGQPMWHTGINYNFGGTGFAGNRGGLWVNMTQTGVASGSSGAGGITAFATGVSTNNTFGGTNPGPGASGAIFSGNLNLSFFAGTTNIQGGQAVEIDVSAASGTTYQNLGALSLVTTTPHVQSGIMLQNTAISIAGQPSSIGFDVGIYVNNRGLQSGSTIVMADWTADTGGSGFPLTRGYDLRPVTFSNDAIATAGFAVGPTGRVRVGTGYFDVLAGGAAIDVSGAICTAGTLTASVTTTYPFDGNHYWCDDPYGGIWQMTFVPGGTTITAITLVVAGTVKGAPPANPITLTPRGRLRIFVPGTITANLTWDTSRTTLALNPSGGPITTGGPLNYTATGGTVARSAQNRAGEVINVHDYGATGNGTTDDTAAIQAAIAAVPASGAVVYLPRGTYLVSSSIALKANTWLRGDGMQATTFLMATNANTNGMIVNANNGDAYITLSDFTVDGNKAHNGAGTSQGIVLTQISNITARSIEVQNVNGHGFITSGNGVNTTRGGHFSRIYVHNNDLFGFSVTFAFRQATIDGLRASNNGSAGNPTFDAVFLDASELIADNIIADSNVCNGIHIHNVFGCTYNNLVATRNGFHGIFVEQITKSVGADWRAQNNSLATSNTYDDIHFANTTGGYGVSTNSAITGIVVGPDANFGTAQERYGLYIEDNVNVNIQLGKILYAAPCLTGNLRPPATIGTLVIDDVMLKPNVGGMFSATGAGTVSGSGVLTLFGGSGVGSRTVPANSSRVGTRYRLRALGYYSTPAAASNLTLGAAFGGTALASSTIAATTNISSGAYFEAEAEITVRAVGSGGTVVAEGKATLFTATGAVQVATWATSGGPVAVNLSVDAVLDLTASWSAPTTHSITTQQSWAEAIGPGG